ncbi:hypothetical protein P7K49_012223, partial [Saguinus oedipus]
CAARINGTEAAEGRAWHSTNRSLTPSTATFNAANSNRRVVREPSASRGDNSQRDMARTGPGSREGQTKDDMKQRATREQRATRWDEDPQDRRHARATSTRRA